MYVKVDELMLLTIYSIYEQRFILEAKKAIFIFNNPRVMLALGCCFNYHFCMFCCSAFAVLSLMIN